MSALMTFCSQERPWMKREKGSWCIGEDIINGSHEKLDLSWPWWLNRSGWLPSANDLQSWRSWLYSHTMRWIQGRNSWGVFKGPGSPDIGQEDPSQQGIIVEHDNSGAWTISLWWVDYWSHHSNRRHECRSMSNQGRHGWKAWLYWGLVSGGWKG
jgi:hypothetical protein